MMRHTLLAVFTLLGPASALSLPDGGWVGWNCAAADRGRCVLERLDGKGQAKARGPHSWGGWTTSVVSSPDGHTIYAGGSSLNAVDTATLRPRWTRPATQGEDRSEFVAAVLAASPDGRTLALSYPWWPLAQPWGSVYLVDAATGKDQSVIAHPGPKPAEAWSEEYRAVTSLAYSPDGRTLALGSRGGGIRLHDLSSGRERTLPGECGKPRPTAHAGAVRRLIWTGEATLVSAANDGTVRQWDTLAARETACRTIASGVSEVAQLGPDRLLAVGGASATLIEPRTLQRLARLGPVVGEWREWKTFGGQVIARDLLNERRWDAQTGREVAVSGPPLATLRQAGWTVTVRPDLRVEVRRSGRRTVLPFLALPPENGKGGVPGKDSWTLSLDGDRLTVGASAFVRVMTMEGETFQNRYVWNLNTGALESCETVSLGQMGWFRGQEAGCRSAGGGGH